MSDAWQHIKPVKGTLMFGHLTKDYMLSVCRSGPFVYVLEYIQDRSLPIVIDKCKLKDTIASDYIVKALYLYTEP